MFKDKLKVKTGEVEDIVLSYLPDNIGHQQPVVDAMIYSVEAGGKRIRPLLMYETYKLFGGNSDVIKPFMAAMEFIHTYSLIHDDLPAMDNDEFRRGKPTTHIKYGEALAILAGDGLLNFGFETAAKAFSIEPGSKKVEEAFSFLSNASGIYGMVGGQTVDVLTDAEGEITREKLDFVYDLKTGALLLASMHIGALLAGADKKDIEKIDIIAKKIGLAFQIQDDILDVTSTTEELGKPVGSDNKNNKATYVTFEGLKKASEYVRRLTFEATELLNSLDCKNDFLCELLLYLVDRKN
ncbi:MAG: polyprenyl synthetase family protein [Lachnospiraceae bacterium]|nr:polyprenyl synthetase family protein [Lachnospiraceae bacterium]